MGKNWEEIRKLAVEYADDNINNRCMNCSESVFEALIRSGAIDAPLDVSAVAYATGFGGGGGGVGFTCGALSSGILANSIAHGRKDPASTTNRMELKETLYKRYNNLVSDFVKVAGSGLCSGIINEFPEGYNDDKTRPNCIRIVIAAAGIAVDYLKMSDEEVANLEYDPAVVGIKNWI
ncbi:MAG: C-GCAxxG-C-C family protein [Oscillospiraceae bacterium]|nr:C-GCAxxG-C-C family protein [Oscillospiraceae bacterium]